MAYHRLYYFGYCEDFILPWQPPQKLSKQTTIFDAIDKTADDSTGLHDKVTDNNLGIDFDITPLEPTILTDDKEI